MEANTSADNEIANTDINNDYTKLRILSLNVCGLKSKLIIHDFSLLISKYDILCFQESKTDETDCKPDLIPGCTTYFNNRKCIRPSGGIVISVKHELADIVKVCDKINSQYISWLSITGTRTTNEDNSLMVGVVYIPPTGSPYNKDDTFNIIEIFQNVESGKPLLLLGEFNARTKFSPDCTTMDDVYTDNIDINNYMNDITNLDNLSIPRDRASQDIGRVNQHGVKRLDLCKLYNIYILNGRCGTDKYIGKVTSKDCSLIDYAIGTQYVFKNVTDFQICDFDPLLSDIHCALIFTYSCKYTTDPNNPVDHSNGVRKEIARKGVPERLPNASPPPP